MWLGLVAATVTGCNGGGGQWEEGSSCSKREEIGFIQVLCLNHCGPYGRNVKDPSP